MQNHRNYRLVITRAVLAAILAGGVSACADQQGAAPVFMKTGASAASAPTAPVRREQHRIVVQSGQTVNGVAHDYRVTPAAVIAANRLQPPYELKAGQRLVIPDVGPTQVAVASAASHPVAPPPPTTSQPPKPVAAATPQPPPPASNPALPPQTIFPQPAAAQPAATASPPAAPSSTAALPPKPDAAAAPQPPPQAQPAASPPPSAGSTAPASAAKSQPDVIPLDGPPPPKAAAVVAPVNNGAAPPKSTAGETASANAAAPVKPAGAEASLPKPAAAEPAAPAAAAPAATTNGAPPVLAQRNPAAALPLPGEEPSPPVSATSSRFAWPIYGHVLTTFGAAANGGRNDGINIAAPRGTPVRSVDSGTVAYVGNEVKGYGNLVLIKHENGWISAYAHLDDPMVKIGEKIRSGQVIAKVGETGGVKQPQLHFELRRGQKPVDPREFLPPTPSAAGPPGNKAG